MNSAPRLAAQTTFANLPWAELGWIVAGASAAAGLATLVERHADPHHAIERAFLGGCFGLALPLATLLLDRQLQKAAVTPTLESLARLGADRRNLFLGTHSVVLASAALLGGWLALCVAVTGGPPVGQTLRQAAAGILGGAGYAAWFGAASSFSKSQRGRLLALAIDWILGLSTGVFALFTPRGHLRSLAGGAGVLELSPMHSGLALVLLGAVAVTFTRQRQLR